MTDRRHPEDRGFVVMQGQFGIGGGYDIIWPVIFDIDPRIVGRTKKRYSDQLDTMSLMFRVDSTEPAYHWPWCIAGVHKLRLQRKQHYITIDLCFESFEFVNVGLEERRKLVLNRIKEAISACVDRIRREKLEFAEVEFTRDVDAAYREIESKWGIT